MTQDIGNLVKRYAKGICPRTAPTVYIVCRRTSALPCRFKSSERPETYALSESRISLV